MWDVVGIVAAVVVIMLLIQVLDLSDIIKERLRGGSPKNDVEERVSRLEQRLDIVEGKQH